MMGPRYTDGQVKKNTEPSQNESKKNGCIIYRLDVHAIPDPFPGYPQWDGTQPEEQEGDACTNDRLNDNFSMSHNGVR